MNDLPEKFDDLMSHLNSEDNGMAQEFRENLVEAIDDGREASAIVSALRVHGVDNWEGYDRAMWDVYVSSQD